MKGSFQTKEVKIVKSFGEAIKSWWKSTLGMNERKVVQLTAEVTVFTLAVLILVMILG
jgi:hypothetical protein